MHVIIGWTDGTDGWSDATAVVHQRAPPPGVIAGVAGVIAPSTTYELRDCAHGAALSLEMEHPAVLGEDG